VTNNNHARGAETERMVAKYLREQGFWMADRRLREGRRDDQGDLDGIPFTTIQVKYVDRPSVPLWMTQTLKQRDTAGTPLCLLVVRKKQKRPEAWDAYMPLSQLRSCSLDEAEAWTWVRMDLRLAAAQLTDMIEAHQLLHSPSDRSLSTTARTREGIAERSYVPFTERIDPASHSTWISDSSSASSATPKGPQST